MIDTAVLRKLLADTTPDEWIVLEPMGGGDHGRYFPRAVAARSSVDGDEEIVPVFSNESCGISEADAQFAATAHNTMPALLDELDRLRAFVAKECTIWLGEPYEGWQLCLGCEANTRESVITHKPGCIVAEARQKKEAAHGE